MSNIHLELIIAVLIFLITRYFICRGVSSEEGFHINIAKLQKEGKVRLNGENDVFVPKGRIQYPILYHYIASVLPYSLINSLSFRIINCTYDLVSLIILYFYVNHALPNEKVYVFESHASLAGCAAILFAFIPSLIPLNSRTRGGGARTMGLFLSFLYFIFLFEFTSSPSFIYLICCIILLFIILLSSLFGHQVAVFTTVVISIVRIDYIYIIPLTIYAILCFIISKNLRTFFLCKFLSHFKYYTSIFEGTIVGDRKNNLLFLPLKKGAFKFDRKKLREFIYLSPLYFLPIIYNFVIFASFSFLFSSTVPSFILFCQSLSLSLTIVAFLTFWYPLSVFGQSERYLEFATPFSLVALLYLLNGTSMIYLSFPFFLLVSIFHLYLMSIKHKYLSSKNLSHAEIEFLKDIKDSVVLVSPYKTTYDIFGLGSSEQKYFYAMTNVNKEANWYKNFNLFKSYSEYKSDWGAWKNSYGITHLLVQKKTLEKKFSDYKGLKLFKEFENYHLYKL